jgi:hypothetical protein
MLLAADLQKIATKAAALTAAWVPAPSTTLPWQVA